MKNTGKIKLLKNLEMYLKFFVQIVFYNFNQSKIVALCKKGIFIENKIIKFERKTSVYSTDLLV